MFFGWIWWSANKNRQLFLEISKTVLSFNYYNQQMHNYILYIYIYHNILFA